MLFGIYWPKGATNCPRFRGHMKALNCGGDGSELHERRMMQRPYKQAGGGAAAKKKRKEECAGPLGRVWRAWE